MKIFSVLLLSVLIGACSSTNDLLEDYNREWEKRAAMDRFEVEAIKNAITDPKEQKEALHDLEERRMKREEAIGHLYMDYAEKRAQTSAAYLSGFQQMGGAAIDRRGAYYRNYNRGQQPIIVLPPGGQ